MLPPPVDKKEMSVDIVYLFRLSFMNSISEKLVKVVYGFPGNFWEESVFADRCARL